MNNLFILHTQYNIILGTSVLLDEFKDCRNDLLVYAEFTVSDELKNSLSCIYDNVFYIREKFEPLIKGTINTERSLWNHWILFKNSPYYKTSYDNVFISQDRPLETLIVNRCKRLNPNCHFANIEEDSYYSIMPEQNEPDYSIGWHTKRPWLIRKLIYGSLYNSDDRKCHYIYGQASYFSTIYSLFPEVVRPQLSHLKKKLIAKESIVQACKCLYSDTEISIPNSSQYYLFFFDLLERYRKPDVIRNIVDNIVEKARTERAIVLLKYHPREMQKFEFEQDGIIEIPFIIPAEILLCDLEKKNVTVFGNATTALIVASKLGFNTISVAGIEGSNNNYMINKFREMGIEVPDSIEEIK